MPAVALAAAYIRASVAVLGSLPMATGNLLPRQTLELKMVALSRCGRQPRPTTRSRITAGTILPQPPSLRMSPSKCSVRSADELGNTTGTVSAEQPAGCHATPSRAAARRPRPLHLACLGGSCRVMPELRVGETGWRQLHLLAVGSLLPQKQRRLRCCV